MRGHVANALETVDFRQVFEQGGQIRLLGSLAHRSAIGIDVLPEQRDLLDTLIGKVGDFGEHVVERPRDLFAPGVGDDAERAVLAAAFHDRHERQRSLDPRRRQVIELFDFGEADVDLRQARGLAARDQLRQAVQRLRTEDDVDVGRAFYDRRAFLACNTAANADHERGIHGLEAAYAPQIMKNPLLRLFTNRASIEENHVGVIGPIGDFQPGCRMQHVGHFGRVILVHLAAKRTDVQLATHGRTAAVGQDAKGRKL